MKVFKNWLCDTMTALGLGLLLTAALTAVLLFLSGILSGFQSAVMGVVLRSGLLIVGALILFVVAGLLLWTRGSRRIREQAKWTQIFRCFGLAPVLLILAVIILTTAGMIDYMLFSIN